MARAADERRPSACRLLALAVAAAAAAAATVACTSERSRARAHTQKKNNVGRQEFARAHSRDRRRLLAAACAFVPPPLPAALAVFNPVARFAKLTNAIVDDEKLAPTR